MTLRRKIIENYLGFSLADELIQSSNGTTDTLLNLGARLRSPSSWPWRLVAILMVLRYVQGRVKTKNSMGLDFFSSNRCWIIWHWSSDNYSIDIMDQNRSIHHSYIKTSSIFSSSWSIITLAFNTKDWRSATHC